MCVCVLVRRGTIPRGAAAKRWAWIGVRLEIREAVQHGYIFSFEVTLPYLISCDSPDPALGERDILGNSLVEVVAHHEHVQVLVDRVRRVRPSLREQARP